FSSWEGLGLVTPPHLYYRKKALQPRADFSVFHGSDPSLLSANQVSLAADPSGSPADVAQPDSVPWTAAARWGRAGARVKSTPVTARPPRLMWIVAGLADV